MTDYRSRRLTYRPLANTPENVAEFERLNVSPTLPPEAVLAYCVELDRVERVCADLAEFEARYEPIGGPTA